MPRKKVKAARELKDWSQVNEALRLIGEKEAAIKAKEASFNEETAKRQKVVDEFCNPLRDEIEMLENGMQNFCVANRADFGGKKSKELANGRVDFRLGQPKVTKAKGFTWAAVLEVVRTSKWAKQFIRLKEELNKDNILAYYAGTEGAADHLAEVYLGVEQEETFGYDHNYGTVTE